MERVHAAKQILRVRVRQRGDGEKDASTSMVPVGSCRPNRGRLQSLTNRLQQHLVKAEPEPVADAATLLLLTPPVGTAVFFVALICLLDIVFVIGLLCRSELILSPDAFA